MNKLKYGELKNSLMPIIQAYSSKEEIDKERRRQASLKLSDDINPLANFDLSP